MTTLTSHFILGTLSLWRGTFLSANQNKIAGSLFLDFSKAFDLVDHSLLIHKLKMYTIDTPYLNKRFQQTHYAGAISDKKEVISGVPQ